VPGDAKDVVADALDARGHVLGTSEVRHRD
jgi:hypothetical protein